jgi:hypothetical protein
MPALPAYFLTCNVVRLAYIESMNTLLNIFIGWSALAMVCFGIVKTFNLEDRIARMEAEDRSF